MSNEPILVANISQVRENARTYMHSIRNLEQLPQSLRRTLRKTLTLTRSWFVLDGGELVVPAKFGGYASMTPEQYDDYRQTHMHGSKAEAAIKPTGKLSAGTKSDWQAVRRLVLSGNPSTVPNENASVYRLEEISREDKLTPNDLLRTASLVEVIRAMRFDNPDIAHREIFAQLS